MRNTSKMLAQAAIIAALYTVVTYLQNLLLPGSASWAIQCRLAEALCVLALFTPAAVPGLAVGCLLSNLISAGVLPLDWLVGTLATWCAAASMRKLRRWMPLALLMPAVFNALLVGWELTVYLGGGFPINCGYVAAGELIVLLIPGWGLYRLMERRKLAKLFRF